MRDVTRIDTLCPHARAIENQVDLEGAFDELPHAHYIH